MGKGTRPTEGALTRITAKDHKIINSRHYHRFHEWGEFTATGDSADSRRTLGMTIWSRRRRLTSHDFTAYNILRHLTVVILKNSFHEFVSSLTLSPGRMGWVPGGGFAFHVMFERSSSESAGFGAKVAVTLGGSCTGCYPSTPFNARLSPPAVASQRVVAHVDQVPLLPMRARQRGSGSGVAHDAKMELPLSPLGNVCSVTESPGRHSPNPHPFFALSNLSPSPY
ncbi:hypothetical protein H6P81_001383 [Aristolochia fimbriata]|uniref:Uncharacterized protein n=1 Tax=Aristolochia fimbriata TaxID=158543 RepID=A0AAV7F6Q8_ARIFI|nr:hypothetical protein H6P81_001383 [Aristolochia fimbriata]